MAAKGLAIIGMHRSGTSMVAQWLAKSGLDMGSELMGSDIGNVRGHYEDMDFVRVHSEIMTDWGMDAMAVESLPSHRVISVSQSAHLVDLIASKDGDHEWGWKDPRTCLFLDQYAKAPHDVDFLVVYRDPALVVDSLVRRKLAMRQVHKGRLFFLPKPIRDAVVAASVEARWATEYWRAWNDYSNLILAFTEQCLSSKLFVVSLDELVRHPEPLQDWLQLRGFELRLADMNSVFDAKLLAKKPATNRFWVSRAEVNRSKYFLEQYAKFSAR